MIRVTVDIVPEGDDSKARTIAELEVWNVTETADPVCDYEYELSGEGQRVLGAIWGHRRSDGWEPLIERALEDVRLSRQPSRAPSKDGKP